jgi:hypothetical protein
MLKRLSIAIVGIAILGSALAARASDISDLDGSYKYMAPQDNEVKQFTFEIKDGKLTFNVPNSPVSEIKAGPQDDFAELLKNHPAKPGVLLFKVDIVDSQKRASKITISKQTANDERPRLTFMFLEEGTPRLMLQAYDSKQTIPEL